MVQIRPSLRYLGTSAFRRAIRDHTSYRQLRAGLNRIRDGPALHPSRLAKRLKVDLAMGVGKDCRFSRWAILGLTDWSQMAYRRLPKPSLEQIVARARILVVDDQDFPYLILFKKDGYNMTRWKDVTKFSEIEQGKFDVILLDLQGIGKKVSQDQGLGVLRHIKTTRPSQVVVAYSNANWPVEYQPFFDMADRVFAKSADYVDFKRAVDELLEEHFDVGFHVSRIEEELATLGVGGWRAKRELGRAIETGDSRRLARLLDKRGVDADSAQVILGLAQLAVGVAQIWTH